MKKNNINFFINIILIAIICFHFISCFWHWEFGGDPLTSIEEINEVLKKNASFVVLVRLTQCIRRSWY